MEIQGGLHLQRFPLYAVRIKWNTNVILFFEMILLHIFVVLVWVRKVNKRDKQTIGEYNAGKLVPSQRTAKLCVSSLYWNHMFAAFVKQNLTQPRQVFSFLFSPFRFQLNAQAKQKKFLNVRAYFIIHTMRYRMNLFIDRFLLFFPPPTAKSNKFNVNVLGEVNHIANCNCLSPNKYWQKPSES